MEKRWVYKKQGDEKIINDLADSLHIQRNLVNLLAQRKIKNFEEAKEFFRPELSKLHDPFLMKDMDKAVDRIDLAISNKEKILIYGDYDVDGTTAVALIYTFIKNFYSNVDYYIPDRYLEGYGVSLLGIDFASENNFSLIISLDCGIKAVDQVDYAKSKGIDFIICDHHRPGKELPKACAILDPKRVDCTYPFDELSGCGVGFKLVQGYNKKNNLPFKELEQYLDLVVVSIASDIVPITGENRILAFFGLKLINTNPRIGLEAILRYSNIKKKKLIKEDDEYFFTKQLTISDLVFSVGPRINAAGRIESGRNSVKLLISKGLETTIKISEQINDYNTERRNLDMLATQQALEMINNDENLKKSKSTVIYNPDWHKGVIGIVASRLTESYYRPTIVLTESIGLITGSARSVKDFDVYDAIDSCSEYLEHFGGHKYAAGLSLKPENLKPFMEKFEQTVDSTIDDKLLIPEIEIDFSLCLNDVTPKFNRILKQFAPFGPGNMAPIFQTDNIIDTGYSRMVGSNHIKLSIIHPDISGLPYSGIAFQQGRHLEKISKGVPFNIVYHIEENEWNGKITLQLNVIDIKFPDEVESN